jgi:hypothetical protein
LSATRRCTCAGHWSRRKTHWVVTQRGFAIKDGERVASGYCELKCRVCYGRWRTKGRYTAQLLDYAERKYKPLPYAAILELIEAGRLKANFQTGDVYKERKRGTGWTGQFIELKPRTQHNPGQSAAHEQRHRYVVLCDANRRREISVGRLVWMLYHRRLIAEGYEIDHEDEDPENNAITNLVAVEDQINRSRSGHANDWDTVPF